MARVDLGLSDDEFGRLTPGEFAIFRERIAIRERRADIRAAVIVKAWGAEATIEEIAGMIASMPDHPRVLTAAEIEAKRLRDQAEFDRALNA